MTDAGGPLGRALAPGSGLDPWKAEVKVGPVADGPHHAIHAYFNTCPESPDGRWVLYYASTAEDGHAGELRIRERATGRETVIARDIATEDAHRAACQQWVSGCRTVVYHTVTAEGQWRIVAVDVPDGPPRLLAKDRQLGFGRRRVFVKVATPAGGDYRTKKASVRAGLVIYDLQDARFLSLTERRGHPAWHPDSRRIIEYGGIFIDGPTGKAARIPDFPETQGAYHPSCSPDGALFTLDSIAEKFGGPPGSWQILVGDAATGESVVLHRFDHSNGARSWRPAHPHPVFSADGRRIYFNVSDGRWTRLFAAGRTR